MGLDMYAFSLDRSEAFASPRDILNYRVPSNAPNLPTMMVNTVTVGQPMPAIPDMGALFIGSKFMLPGSTLLHRWYKHPNLHGWMQRRWNVLRAGKLQKEFGCLQRVPLNVQDLDALEHAVKHCQLPPTTGEFFGTSDGSEQADDLAFIAAARSELAAGKFVYYTSWW